MFKTRERVSVASTAWFGVTCCAGPGLLVNPLGLKTDTLRSSACSATSALKLGRHRACGVGTRLALDSARPWRLPNGSALDPAGPCLNAERAENAEGRRDTSLFTEQSCQRRRARLDLG